MLRASSWGAGAKKPAKGAVRTFAGTKAVGLDFPERFFNHLLEVVFAGFDDAKFALGIFGGIAGVCGVDHDRGTEFAAD